MTAKPLQPGEEELINMDLDVKNILDQFPNNEFDSYIYIRAHFEEKQPKDDVRCSINVKGHVKSLMLGIINFMSQDKGYEEAVINAVINYMSMNQYKVKPFLRGLEQAVNYYNKKKGDSKNG